MLAQAMLSQRHRMILRFQRQNLVESSSSSSDSDDNDFDPMRMMESKNPLVRLITYGKIKKMMTQFRGERLDILERNMIRGMFKRKIKDFAEKQQEESEYVTLLDRLLNLQKLSCPMIEDNGIEQTLGQEGNSMQAEAIEIEGGAGFSRLTKKNKKSLDVYSSLSSINNSAQTLIQRHNFSPVKQA